MSTLAAELSGFSELLRYWRGYSLWVMTQVGYIGIWTGALANPGSAQVLADLVVAGLLMCVWMVKDARERGANAWPFVLVTLGGGSFGPLLYLLLRPNKSV